MSPYILEIQKGDTMDLPYRAPACFIRMIEFSDSQGAAKFTIEVYRGTQSGKFTTPRIGLSSNPPDNSIAYEFHEPLKLELANLELLLYKVIKGECMKQEHQLSLFGGQDAPVMQIQLGMKKSDV